MELIDRKALTQDLNNVIFFNNRFPEAIQEIASIIGAQPTITERTATRAGLDGPNSIFDLYECSECGHADTIRNKYCPNCGAKFKEAENG